MKKYKVLGGSKLSGTVKISGAKNVVLKAIVAACITDEEVVFKNVPEISDVTYMLDMVRGFGGKVDFKNHILKIRVKTITNIKLPLDTARKMRASSLFFAPFLIRNGNAKIPNPGGDKIGARRIDMHIEGLKKIGVDVKAQNDGYFIASTKGLKGTTYRFKKNTHTGTEQLILASVLAHGTTILENTALEPEVDELITLLNLMGGDIKREKNRIIKINGVKKLNGATYEIKSDRNEAVTFAIASALTGGNIWLKGVNTDVLASFINTFRIAGGAFEEKSGKIRFYIKDKIMPIDIVTQNYPGFMTDWQGPWCILMTQADGESTIHETIYEDRFQYVTELIKMGADIKLYNPEVKDAHKFYNFHYNDRRNDMNHAIKINGNRKLHGAKLVMMDLRAGATLVIASLIAEGESEIGGVEQIERGYENFDVRLRALGANIKVEENN